jgi:hypothetical protein
MSKQTQTIVSLIVGLIIGLVLGGAFIGSNDNLREDLFGTAGVEDEGANDTSNASVSEVAHYYIPLDNVDDWLSESIVEAENAEPSEELGENITFIDDVVNRTASLTAEDQSKAEEASLNILRNVTVGLLKESPENLDEAPKEYGLKMCLGYEEDLYNPMQEPTSYVELEIPVTEAEKLNLTEVGASVEDDQETLEFWSRAEQAKSTFWMVLYCYE